MELIVAMAILSDVLLLFRSSVDFLFYLNQLVFRFSYCYYCFTFSSSYLFKLLPLLFYIHFCILQIVTIKKKKLTIQVKTK